MSTDSVASRVIKLVGKNKRVLELGSASGHMTKLLTEFGCSVVSIDVNPDAVSAAQEYAEHAYCINLDTPDGLYFLESLDPFDVVLAADVFEHLRNPCLLIRKVKSLLNENGYLVFSTPNIAHSGVIASLICGEFDYRETGLLDSSHVHFYTESSIKAALVDADLSLAYFDHFDAGVEHPEFARYWEQLPENIRHYLQNKEGGGAFQFVAAATRKPLDGLLEVLGNDLIKYRQELAIAAMELNLVSENREALREEISRLRLDYDSIATEVTLFRRSRILRFWKKIRSVLSF